MAMWYCNVFFVFHDMFNTIKQIYFSDEWLTRNIYSNWIEWVLGNGKSVKWKLSKKVIQICIAGYVSLLYHKMGWRLKSGRQTSGIMGKFNKNYEVLAAVAKVKATKL